MTSKRAGAAVAVALGALVMLLLAVALHRSSPPPKWTEVIGALGGLVAPAALVVGGVLGYRRFLREQPYYTRANVSVTADLFTYGEVDLVRAVVSVHAIGKTRLQLVKEGTFIAVELYAADHVGEPPEWDQILAIVEIFVDQFIEAGETLEEAVLIPVGVRRGDALAYRVEFGLRVHDPQAGNHPYDWRATTILPVAIDQSDTEPTAGP